MPYLQVQAHVEGKKPENRKGQLLSQKDRMFTESLSVLFTFIYLTKCTIWVFLGQGVSVSALMTVRLNNSLLGELSCALQMFTSSPWPLPRHQQQPTLPLAVTIGNVSRHSKCTLANRITRG